MLPETGTIERSKLQDKALSIALQALADGHPISEAVYMAYDALRLQFLDERGNYWTDQRSASADAREIEEYVDRVLVGAILIHFGIDVTQDTPQGVEGA